MSDDAPSCALPRPVKVADTPHTMLPDLQRKDIFPLELDGCNVVTFTMAMNEFEKPVGLRFDQWPEVIRIRLDREVIAWAERNPAATIRAVTQGINERCCTLALHWKPKA